MKTYYIPPNNTNSTSNLNRTPCPVPTHSPPNPSDFPSLRDPFTAQLLCDYLDLTRKLNNLSGKVVENCDVETKLRNELHEARGEIRRLKDQIQVLQPAEPPFSPSANTSRAESLSPSDSISQVQSRSGSTGNHIALIGSSIRPIHLPFSVLWNLEDCREDPVLASLDTEPLRPAMNLAIRTKEGALISVEKYKNIRADTAALADANLPKPEWESSTQRRRTSREPGGDLAWYKSCYPHKIIGILQELEHMHEELRLCSGHWKAEHMLMQHLNPCTLALQEKSPARRPSCSNSDVAKPTPPVPQQAVVPPSVGVQNTAVPEMNGHVNPEKRSRVDSLRATMPAKKRLRVEDTNGGGFQKEGPPSCQLYYIRTPTDSDANRNASGLTSQETNIPIYSRQGMNATNTNIASISVDPSLINLNYIFMRDFPLMKAAPLLFNRLAVMAATEHPREPSNSVASFISRIENADPNSADITADNTNADWGRHQFTAGTQTITSVLLSWDVIGSVATACRLIAAAIKTCRVARHICRERGVVSSMYASDVYLDWVINKLINLTLDQSTEHRAPVQLPQTNLVPTLTPADNNPTSQPVATVPHNRRGALFALVVNELKAWTLEHNIVVPVRSPRKADYVDAILSSANIPSDHEIQALIIERKRKRGVLFCNITPT